MAIQFSNLASTVLASGVSNSATSVSVANASLFPSLGAGDYFYATIGLGSGSEIVKVTAVSGTTFTVVRGARQYVRCESPKWRRIGFARYG